MSRPSHRRASVVVLLAALVLVATAQVARASSIVNLYSFSGSTFDIMAVQPFDPALGTLDSVGVSIIGNLSISGTTAFNFITTAGGPVPQPYTYSVTVDQDFFGLANKYFDFANNSTFLFNGTATGAGEPFFFGTNFSYGFTFTATTDLFGFTFPSYSSSAGTIIPPLFGVVGMRSDFLATIVPLDQIQLLQTWSAQSFGAPTNPTINSVNTAGSLSITYNYTPPPAAVPEPASLSLVALGLIGLGIRRYRAIHRD